MRRPGSAALDLVHVACGQFDAFWELTLKPWDFAAGMLLVREAGGVVTTVSGGSVPLTNSSLLAGNPEMHAWLARTLADATPAGSILQPKHTPLP
jgi:myo-inositol-1(or 4)-monophosphatase